MDANSSTAVLFDFGGTLDADRLAWKARVCDDAGIRPLFSVLVDSAHVGCAKPEPRIFLHALDALGLGPADATFVGDSPSRDMAGARAVGMRHIWLVSATAPAQDPCCRGDRVIHSLKDLEALLQ